MSLELEFMILLYTFMDRYPSLLIFQLRGQPIMEISRGNCLLFSMLHCSKLMTSHLLLWKLLCCMSDELFMNLISLDCCCPSVHPQTSDYLVIFCFSVTLLSVLVFSMRVQRKSYFRFFFLTHSHRPQWAVRRREAVHSSNSFSEVLPAFFHDSRMARRNIVEQSSNNERGKVWAPCWQSFNVLNS